MIYVALVACGSTAVVAIVLGQLLRVVIRQGARERELLVNQICHLSGRPWREAPSYEPPMPEPERELVMPGQWPE